MTTGLPTYDTKPWYRQFWPWLLISLPGTVVVAGFITLYIANKYSDDLVANEPYRIGLAINRQLEKKRIAEQRGIQASFNFVESGSEQRVEVRLWGLAEDEALTLTLSHPLEADRDFAVRLQYDWAGLYVGRLTQDVAARWHWTLESNSPAPWRLDGSVEHSDIGNESAN